MNIISVLKQEESKLQRQLNAIQSAIAALGDTTANHTAVSNGSGTRRTLSPSARARISRAAKARWAKIRAEKAKGK